MRATYFICFFGVALACSGEPFTASVGSPGEVGGMAQGAAGMVERAGSGGDETRPRPDDLATTGGQSSPRAGSGGGGAAGSAAQPEAGGDGGASGGAPDAAQGGEAGAPAEPSCPSAATGNWELGYFPELRDATTQESHPFFRITSRSASASLNRFAIRYYFTKESELPESGACYWVTGDHCQLARLEFGELATPTAGASRYLQVTFPNASNVLVLPELSGVPSALGAPSGFEVRVGFKTGAALLVQTNDYSFDADAAAPSNSAPFPYKPWPKATLYVDGKLVWGTEPCASGRVVVSVPAR